MENYYGITGFHFFQGAVHVFPAGCCAGTAARALDAPPASPAGYSRNGWVSSGMQCYFLLMNLVLARTVGRQCYSFCEEGHRSNLPFL